MSDMKTVLDAIEAQNSKFEEFKSTQDAKLEAIKKAGATDDFDAKLKAIADDMANDRATHKKALEDLEAKARRPQLGSDGKPVDEVGEEHRKAFGGYMRKGVEYDRGLEQKALNIGTGGGGGFAGPE